MKIIFYATGYMRTRLPEERYSMELDNNSTLGDFFDKLDDIMGGELGKAVWNREKKRFRGPVTVRVDGEVVKDESYCLKDNQSIEISRLLIGG